MDPEDLLKLAREGETTLPAWLVSRSVVGRVALCASPVMPGAWMVYSSRIQPAYRGTGLGQTLYLIAMALADGPVHPDVESYVRLAAWRVWDKLKKQGFIYEHEELEVEEVEELGEGEGNEVVVVRVRPETETAVDYEPDWPLDWEGVLNYAYVYDGPDINLGLVDISHFNFSLIKELLEERKIKVGV